MKRFGAAALTVLVLAAACGEDVGQPVGGRITTENILLLLTASEVNVHGRDGAKVESTVVDRMAAAVEAGVDDVELIESWTEVDYAERPDGARVKLTVIDHTDATAASARFDLAVRELALVESDQGIGDRFAGLAPKTGGFDTIVLVLVGDKTLLFTTLVALTDPTPIVDSEGLVDLSRLVAPRVLP